jgi:hypothetical protein
MASPTPPYAMTGNRWLIGCGTMSTAKSNKPEYITLPDILGLTGDDCDRRISIMLNAAARHESGNFAIWIQSQRLTNREKNLILAGVVFQCMNVDGGK